MDCTGKIKEVNKNFYKNKFVLTVEINEDIQTAIEDIKDCEKLKISLAKYREKRSLDANSFFWLLIGKLAQKENAKSREDIYKSYIRETGAFEILPIRVDALEQWEKIWQSKGEGWIVEDIGKCRNLRGYHNVKCYYGTSVYNSKEMAHIIDLVVQDCKDAGIETMTPDEVERIKSLWK